MSSEDSGSDSEPSKHPYEPTRLADPGQQDEISRILCLTSESVTNTHPVREPQRYGAGGVRRFAPNRSATLPRPPHSVDPRSASSNVQPEGRPINLTDLSPRPASTVGQSGRAADEALTSAAIEPTLDGASSPQINGAAAPVAPSQGEPSTPTSGTIGAAETTPSNTQSPAALAVAAPPQTGAAQSSTTAPGAQETTARPEGNAQASHTRVAVGGQSGSPATGRPAPSNDGPQIGTPQPDPPQNMTSGYASLSGFMSSDRVFTVFRRFDTLSIRSLLYLQDELFQLEGRLKAVDQADRDQGTPAALWRLHSRREDDNAERIALMAEIRAKLKEYREQLLQHSTLLSLGKANGQYVESVANWIDGMKPVIEEESHFLDDTADIAPLFTDHRNRGLERFVERKLSSLFSTRKHRARPHAQDRPEVTYYSTTTIHLAVRASMTLFAAVIMVGPIFALSYVHRTVSQLVLVVFFTFLLALALSVLTQIQNHEVFQVMAAYCAVMVVFVGTSQPAR